MNSTLTALTDEQVRLVNDIWDHAERVGQLKDGIQKLVAPEGIALSEYQLRRIALGLREKFRKGTVPEKAEMAI
jgi:hypothetical protein